MRFFGSADGEPRTATYEVWERAQKSEPIRRIIAVAVEPSPGELFSERFFLCTSFVRREGGSLDRPWASITDPTIRGRLFDEFTPYHEP